MKVKTIIHFINGREEKYEVDILGDSGTKARVDEFVQSPNLVLRTKNELIVIPSSAIESISFSIPESQELESQLKYIRKAKRIK